MFAQRQLTIDQLSKKTTLTDAALIASLSEREKAGALDIVNMFEPQRRVFKNLLRLFFTVAGFSWFVIFFPSLGDLPTDKFTSFRTNQYQIYLILLTLWGFELKMQEKRIAFLLNLASALGKKWYALTYRDIANAGKLYLFDLFMRKANDGSPAAVGFVWVLIALVLLQFVRQGIILFG